jgi:hypothetical protein
MLTTDPEREVPVCHVCIDGNYAPHDFVGSDTELWQRNVQQRMVRTIQMKIAFVHFCPGCVQDLNAANGRLDIFRKSDSNFARRCLDRTAYGRIRAFKESMCFKPG